LKNYVPVNKINKNTPRSVGLSGNKYGTDKRKPNERPGENSQKYWEEIWVKTNKHNKNNQYVYKIKIYYICID